MGSVEHHGETELLHHRDTTIVDYQVLIPEGGAPFGNHHPVVAGIDHLLGGKLHSLGREELPLLDIHHAARLSSGHQQVGLPAQEGGNLQHIDILGCHARLVGRVYIGHHRYLVGLAHPAQNRQSLLVADTGKGVESRAVGLAIRPLEYIGYLQRIGYLHNLFGNLHSHGLALDYTGAGQQEEVAAVGMFQFFEFHYFGFNWFISCIVWQATRPAVSVRRRLGPSITGRKPQAMACSTSSGLKSPSGPISIRAFSPGR